MDRIKQREQTAALSAAVHLIEMEAHNLLKLEVAQSTDAGLKPYLRANIRTKMVKIRELENLLEEVVEADPSPEIEIAGVIGMESEERLRIISALRAGIKALDDQEMEYTFKRILVLDEKFAEFLGLRMGQFEGHASVLDDLMEEFREMEDTTDYEEAQ